MCANFGLWPFGQEAVGRVSPIALGSPGVGTVGWARVPRRCHDEISTENAYAAVLIGRRGACRNAGSGLNPPRG
eukprot:4419002-Prymnesium_polylepis.1